LATSKTVDFFAIDRHNFGGETINLQYYDSGWQSAENFSGLSDDVSYQWELGTARTSNRFLITISSLSNPYCAEITLGQKVFDVHPNFPGPVPRKIPNQDVRYTRSGHRWGLMKGDSKWSFDYKFTLGPTKMAVLKQCLTDIDDGLRPFYMYDHDGDCRFVEMAMPVEMPYVIPGGTSPGGEVNDAYQDVEFTVQEVF